MDVGRWQGCAGGSGAQDAKDSVADEQETRHHGPQRRRAIVAWSAAGASAGASGFAVGGVVADLASWRLVFWACLPLAAALAAAIVWSVPRDHGPELAGSLNVAAAAAFTAAVQDARLLPGYAPPGLGCVAGSEA